MGAPYTGAVWNRTTKLGSSRYPSGWSNPVPVAKCTVRKCALPAIALVRCGLRFDKLDRFLDVSLQVFQKEKSNFWFLIDAARKRTVCVLNASATF